MHLEHDHLGADAFQNGVLQPFGHHVGAGLEHQRRCIGRTQPVAQPVVAEIGDRRKIDGDFGQHHESDEEDEYAACQPEADTPRPRRMGIFLPRWFQSAGIAHKSVSLNQTRASSASSGSPIGYAMGLRGRWPRRISRRPIASGKPKSRPPRRPPSKRWKWRVAIG